MSPSVLFRLWSLSDASYSTITTAPGVVRGETCCPATLGSWNLAKYTVYLYLFVSVCDTLDSEVLSAACWLVILKGGIKSDGGDSRGTKILCIAYMYVHTHNQGYTFCCFPFCDFFVWCLKAVDTIGNYSK